MNEITWNSSSMGLPRSRLGSFQAADRQIGFHSARGVQILWPLALRKLLLKISSTGYLVGRLLSVFAQEIIAEVRHVKHYCPLRTNGLPRTRAQSERKFD